MSRKRAIKILRHVAIAMCFMSMIAILFAVRLSHPEMTETQLLVSFWYIWIIVFGLGIMGSLLIGQ